MAKKKDYRPLLTTPYETGIRDFTSITRFFQYHAPCIDSAQSPGSFTDSDSDMILSEMLSSVGIRNTTRIIKSIKPASWAKDDLDGFEIDFETSKILCDKYNNETDLHAILRHIRNALAHGYLYVWRKRSKSSREDYILLIDYDSKKHRPTAKLVLTMSILQRWKTIIESHYNLIIQPETLRPSAIEDRSVVLCTILTVPAPYSSSLPSPQSSRPYAQISAASFR